MIEFFIGIVGLVCLLYWMQKTSSQNKLIDSFPGPKTLPILGNALGWSNKPGRFLSNFFFNFFFISIILDEMFIILRNYAKKYFATYQLWGGITPFLNIVTAEDAEVSG